MTNEEYLRVLLLGGMQLTVVPSRPRGSILMPRAAGEPQGVLSLPELERLQLTTLGTQSQWIDSVPALWNVRLRAAQGFYKAGTRPQPTAEYSQSPNRNRRLRDEFALSVINDALISVSQGAQWDSLRTDILSRLESVYLVRDEGRVRSFLEKNAFLAPLLLRASSKIRDYFSASTVALEVSLDPENGKYQELWARIQTHLSPTDALPILTRFDEEWWLQASAASRNLLNIKLEYV